MRVSLRIFISALIFFTSSLAARNTDNISIEFLSLEEGVSHNLVYSILNDRQGFMWFGTMYGLVKYDGVRYTVYRHDPDDINSLSYDDIISLYEDSRGYIWVSTWGGGVNCLDPESGHFTRYLHHPEDSSSIAGNIVWAISETNDNDGISIWLGTNAAGLSRLQIPNSIENTQTNPNTFIHYNKANQQLPGNHISKLYTDSYNRLWIMTPKGLTRFEIQNGVEKLFPSQPEAPTIATSFPLRINNILETSASHYLLATNHGIFPMQLQPDGKAEIFDAKRYEKLNKLSRGFNSLLIDSYGSLWAGSFRGLYQLPQGDQNGEKIRRYDSRQSTESRLQTDNIIAMCEDQSGVLWVGTYFGGLHKLIRNKKRFELLRHRPAFTNSLSSNKISSIHIDTAENVWITTIGGGLNKIRFSETQIPEITRFQTNSNTKDGLKTNILNHVYELPFHNDTEQTLWLGSNRGLIKMQPEKSGKDRFQNWAYQPDNPNSLSNNTVNSIIATAHPQTGRWYLWIATVNGLNRIALDSLDTGKFTRYYQTSPDNPNGLPHKWIISLYTSRDGQLWIGSFGGLSRYDWQTNSFINYQHQLDDPTSLSNNYVYAMHEDARGNFWIGTSNGLNRFLSQDGTFANYREKDGLPNGVINGILEDSRGLLWLSTNKGLSCFNPVNVTFRNFDISDGLQSNIFNPGAYQIASDGKMFLGGINGLNFFHPDDISESILKPAVRITSIRCLNSEDNFSVKSELLNLSPNQNSLSFQFAAMDFTAPEKNQYAYKLTGIDKDWVNAGQMPLATYPGLPPGNYQFLVKASNHDGVWNETPASIAFIIHPPFWQTSWFYALCLLGILLGTYLMHRRLVRQKLREVTLVNNARQKERASMREKTARDYHDTLGHQLTKISLYSELIRRQLKPSDVAGNIDETQFPEAHQNDYYSSPADFSLSNDHLLNYLEKITTASNDLCSDTRDFIWALNPEKDSLYDTMLHLKTFGETLFEESSIELTVNGIEKEMEKTSLNMDWRRHLILIFKEALNNILKHAHAQQVILAVTLDSSRLTVQLQDDGRGFLPNEKGCGNGLRNMHQRAESLDSIIKIVSDKSTGTTILFQGILPENDLEKNKTTNGRVAKDDSR